MYCHLNLVIQAEKTSFFLLFILIFGKFTGKYNIFWCSFSRTSALEIQLILYSCILITVIIDSAHYQPIFKCEYDKLYFDPKTFRKKYFSDLNMNSSV